MKIKTAYIIEILVRSLLMVVALPFVLIGWILLELAKPFQWVIDNLGIFADKIGHKLFLKSKIYEYVKNEYYKKNLTAIKAYKLKSNLLKEQAHLSENAF